MDPDKCLKEILTAIANEDRETARLRMHDLDRWFMNGGYFPSVTVHPWRIGGITTFTLKEKING